MTPQAIGFWGPPTSSVDFCEANYAVSPYVCEFANAVSSLVMVAVGVAGAAAHRATLERRFVLAYAALAVVGLGSAAFHATLRFELQMQDELPMIYLALVMVFILLEIDPARSRGPRLSLPLAAYGAALTALCVGTRGRVEFWAFQLSFGTLELFCLARVTQLALSRPLPVVRRLFAVGMSCYLAAIAAWFADMRFCGVLSGALPSMGVPNPQLHAVWHVLASLGFYALLLLLGHERLVRLGRRPKLVFLSGFVPRIDS